MWEFVDETFDRYIITTDGELYDTYNHLPIKQYISTAGYISVSIYIDGKLKTKLLHRLVAKAFISNVENKPQVNHIDGNKSNNKVWNLEWVTAQENMTHSSINRLHPKTIACCELDGGKEIIKIFLSINDAARKLDVQTKRIINCGRGISNDTDGRIIRYYDLETKSYIRTKFDNPDYKYKSSRKRKIKCINNNKIYNSQCHAARELGISQCRISENLNKNKRCKYDFEYINE